MARVQWCVRWWWEECDEPLLELTSVHAASCTARLTTFVPDMGTFPTKMLDPTKSLVSQLTQAMVCYHGHGSRRANEKVLPLSRLDRDRETSYMGR